MHLTIFPEAYELERFHAAKVIFEVTQESRSSVLLPFHRPHRPKSSYYSSLATIFLIPYLPTFKEVT